MNWNDLAAQSQRRQQELKARLRQWVIEYDKSTTTIKTLSQQTLAALSLAGMVALQTPGQLPVEAKVVKELTNSSDLKDSQTDSILASLTQEEHAVILTKLNEFVKQPAGHLEKSTQLYIEQQLSDMLGFEVTAELENQRLNHSIGIMGGEQHLRRFPEDSLEQHDGYWEAGLAPNRGAFGWFTEQGQLSEVAKQREKYYFAVQTMYLPEWSKNHPHLKEWYKFRKMITINPANKKAVVGVVGDAGPAQWVGKQFGGSPEVIREGQIWSPAARGHVLLFFVNDPENKVALGPIDLGYDTLQKTVALKVTGHD